MLPDIHVVSYLSIVAKGLATCVAAMSSIETVMCAHLDFSVFHGPSLWEPIAFLMFCILNCVCSGLSVLLT